MPDPRISQGANGALAWLTTPAMARTEPMHGPKTPSGANEATGLSAAAGVGSSCHSPVLLKQRNHVSDSPGIAFGGVELVAGCRQDRWDKAEGRLLIAPIMLVWPVRRWMP